MEHKRYGLVPYVGEYVLCKGWIKGWEDISKHPQRRVLISQPTIRKPNKNLLFDNQEIISKEHHLNLFIDNEKLTSYQQYEDFELYKQLAFTGVVKEYQRKNGTIDYGIYPTEQSTLHYRLALITYNCMEMVQEDRYSQKLKRFCELSIPLLEEMIDEVELSGDKLPTFFQTYNQYMRDLNEWCNGLKSIVGKLRNIHQSRAYRRGKFKVKKRNDGKPKQQYFIPLLS